MSYTNGLDDPSAFFQTVIYTGNATARSITFDGNSDMQPDWNWTKVRNSGTYHNLADSVRGATKQIYSNTNDAEASATDAITSFNSNGFSIGSNGDVNANTKNIVSWNWKAGTSFTNDASSTGIGSLDSTGSVNDTAGFSIVSYTGNTTAGATIKHGLSTKPDVIICKARQNSGGAIEWVVYHKGISTPQNNTLTLNTSAAKVDRTIAWNDTAPTSSVFSVGTWVGTNATVPMIAYVFSEKQGYSKFGSYIGNGNASGPMIVTGFSPAWLMIKQTAASNDWFIIDNKREPFNPNNVQLVANGTSASTNKGDLDLLSNGFKPRSSNAAWNENNAQYIYMAFAEQPFVTSSGVPACAR